MTAPERESVPTAADEWCREESCRHRHWTSGSMPTHKRGAHCPPPSAPLAAMRPSPDSEAVARVEALAHTLVDAPGQGPLAAALIFGALAGGDAAKLAEYERAALGAGMQDGSR